MKSNNVIKQLVALKKAYAAGKISIEKFIYHCSRVQQIAIDREIRLARRFTS